MPLTQTVLLPEILSEQPSEKGIVLDLRIPEGLTYFEGHFDQIAVVPGVVQVHWAAHYGREKLGVDLPFSHMEAIKFRDIMIPNQYLQLILGFRCSDLRLEFSFQNTDTYYSSGRIYFHADSV